MKGINLMFVITLTVMIIIYNYNYNYKKSLIFNCNAHRNQATTSFQKGKECSEQTPVLVYHRSLWSLSLVRTSLKQVKRTEIDHK